MVETLRYERLLAEDFAYGTGTKDVRLQNGAYASLHRFDPGYEWAYVTGNPDAHIGKGRTTLVSQPLPINRAITIPANETVVFTEGGSLLLNANVTCLGRMLGPRRQIFTGNGTVSFTRQQEWVAPEWWGADPSGTADCKAAFDKAVASLTTAGGTVLGGGTGYTYLFASAMADIRTSDMILDMAGSLCKATTNFNLVSFDGDSGVDGDYSQVIERCVFRNAQIGDANDTNNRLAPPEFTWARDCLMENVVVKGRQNGINLKVVSRAEIRNVHMIGINPGQIGLIMHMVDDTLVNDCHFNFESLGAIVGLQHKGGRNVVVKGCTIRNQAYNGGADDYGFFIRGDSPGSASSSTGTYPFSTLSWGVADDRRGCHNTRVVNCSVEDSPDIQGFYCVEGRGTQLVNCTTYNCKVGAQLIRAVDWTDRDFLVSGCLFELNGVTNNHAGNGRGMRVISNHASPVTGVRIINTVCRDSDGNGFNIQNADDVVVQGCSAFNSGQGGNTLHDDGFQLISCARPKLIGCTAIDDQGSPTQHTGFNVQQSCTYPHVSHCTARNNTTRQIQSWVPGFYDGNDPGEGTATTTDATANDSIWRCKMGTNAFMMVDLLILARQASSTNCAMYRLIDFVRENSGVAARAFSNSSPYWSVVHSFDTAQLTDSSGGTANDTIAAITTGGAAADQGPTRDAIADLAAKVNALIMGANRGFENDTSWGVPALTHLSVDQEFYLSVTGKAATTISYVVFDRSRVIR